MARRRGAAPGRAGRTARLLAGLLGTVFVLVAAALITAALVLRGSIPKRDGRFRLSGLASSVTVTFDERGIPQIWAERERDAWFALGFVQAGDRLFQMDLLRRLATGRLSELVGARALGLDRTQRALAFEPLAERASARLDPATREALEAFVAGINAWIDRGRLPFEYRMLRARPRPWTIEDVAASFLFQSYDLNDIVPSAFHALVERIGEERAFAILASEPAQGPAIVEAAAPTESALAASPASEGRGSNSWVLAPARTRSGGAILANDPHLDVGRLPGPLYLAGVHAKDTGLSVVGATVAGLPYYPLGHNAHCAWGATAAGCYTGAIVKVSGGADSLHYRWRGAERAFEATSETLRAHGAEPRVVVTRTTHLGPVVRRGDDGSWRVRRWVGYELPVEDALAAGFAQLRARDFDAFRSAVSRTGCIGISWTYAGRDGRIGYQLGGRLPRYEAGAPFRIVADPDSGWSEIAAFDENPWIVDPPGGWVAAANNPPAAGIAGEYAYVRARRFSEMLPALDGTDATAVRTAQLDRVSLLGARHRALAAEAARAAGSDTTAALLESWDGTTEVTNRAAAVFFTWWARLAQEIFLDEVGPELPYVNATTVLDGVVSDVTAPWWDDVRTTERESRGAILTRAMRAAIAEVAGRTWGDIHPYEPAHPFADTAVLERLLRLRRGPYPMPGHGSTVNVARGSGARPPFFVQHGPVCRFVIDMSDPDAATLSVAAGQSGNPLDRHYADFIQAWISGEAWTVPFTRGAVEERAVGALVLEAR